MTNKSNDMIAFEEKVVNFQKENEEAQRVIIKGSDEHLDILLNIKKVLDPLTEKYSVLMNELIPHSNNLSFEELTKAIPALLELYSSSIKLVAVLKRSRIARDIKTCAQNYYSQVENLHEFIYDLENLRDDEDLGKILEEINNY
jgi:hypothetical protein